MYATGLAEFLGFFIMTSFVTNAAAVYCYFENVPRFADGLYKCKAGVRRCFWADINGTTLSGCLHPAWDCVALDLRCCNGDACNSPQRRTAQPRAPFCYVQNAGSVEDGYYECMPESTQCFTQYDWLGWETGRGCLRPNMTCLGRRLRCCSEDFCNRPRVKQQAIDVLPSQLVSAIGIVGNVLVIAAVMGDAKMRHTSMFLLLANLAFNDFCYLFVPFVAYFCKANASTWGGLYANGAFYLKRVSILVSALTSVAICLERYFAIVHPLRVRALFRPSRTILYIAAVWVVGCSLNLFYLAIVMGKLFIPFGAWRYAGSSFVAVDMVIVYIAPITTMTILYTKTCRTLWQTSAARQTTGSAPRSDEVLSPTSQLRNTSKVASRRAVVKMLIICVIVFYGCYSLYAMYWLLKSFLVYVPYDDIWLGLGMLAIDIACAVNPFVYALYSETFRHRVASFLPCRVWRRILPSTISGSKKFLFWLGVVGTSFGAAATAFAVVQTTLAYDRIAFAAFSILLLTAHFVVITALWLQKWWLLDVYTVLQALCIAPTAVLFVFHARFALTAFWEEEFCQYSALIGGAKCGLLLLLALVNLLCCQAVRRAKECISNASASRDASTEASTSTTRT